jgi:hypothetical protein
MYALTYIVLLIVISPFAHRFLVAGDDGYAATTEARFQGILARGNNMAVYIILMAPLWLAWVAFALVYVPFWRVGGYGSAMMWALGMALNATLITKATRYFVVGSEGEVEAETQDGDEPRTP